MPTAQEIAQAVAAAQTWDERVALVRRVPEQFGTGSHAAVYAEIAKRVYSPSLNADFAYIHWRSEYELPQIEKAYTLARDGTDGFASVERETLARVIKSHPETVKVFRLILGFIGQEFAEACALVAETHALSKVTKGTLKLIEGGGAVSEERAMTCAAVVDLAMSGSLFPRNPLDSEVRLKLDKPDTARGWESIRDYAANGVPLSVLLHQRAYGGAFRQLSDATSSQRGDLLEDPVEELYVQHGIPYVRTGAHNQASVQERFGLTVRPAPDFVVFDSRNATLRAILECKVANDGGTARDKAARFRSLRVEANRLGGVPVFAVLGGLGWRRTADALGPVVRDTDGRTFTVGTLGDMITVEPFPTLRGLVG